MSIRIKMAGVLIVWWLVSCSHDERIPRGVIGISEMSAILLDMQMAQAYNDTYIPDTSRRPEDREKRIKVFYKQILMLHHADKETFLKSYHFYEQHPDLMKKIYGLMQHSIDQKSAYIDSLRRQEYERSNRAREQGRQIKMKENLLFLYKPFIEAILPQQPLVFKPDYPDHEKRVPVKAVKNFLFLRQSLIDSIPLRQYRVFRPDYPG